MQFIWEEKDIIAGRILQKPDTGITGTWIISWIQKKHGEQDHTWGLTSLADGMFSTIGTKEQVVATLNLTVHWVPMESLFPARFGDE